MSRWIDADHLRKWILSWWERTEPTSEYLKGGDILNQIDREPSIDIVRCRECKYKEKCEQIVVFDIGENQIEGRKIDFCSYGVKKGTDDV